MCMSDAEQIAQSVERWTLIREARVQLPAVVVCVVLVVLSPYGLGLNNRSDAVGSFHAKSSDFEYTI